MRPHPNALTAAVGLAGWQLAVVTDAVCLGLAITQLGAASLMGILGFIALTFPMAGALVAYAAGDIEL